MATTFVFDDREAALLETFRERAGARDDVRIECRRLDLGDVHIEGPADSAPRLLVVERKAVADLLGSVLDGRLAEQWGRLGAWHAEQPAGAAVVALVVEGAADPARTFPTAADPDARYRHFVKATLGMALQAAPAEGRLVLRTADLRETAALLLTLRRTVATGGGPAAAAVTHCGAMPRKQSSDVFLRHLCCTRGVSYQRAVRVRAAGFTDVADVLRRCAADPAATSEALAGAVGGGRIAARLLQDLGAPPVVEAGPRRRRRRLNPPPAPGPRAAPGPSPPRAPEPA